MATMFLPMYVMLLAFSSSLTNGAGTDVRNLQSNVTFLANYSADFQYLLDTFCDGDPPVLQITCFGDLTILGTSDPSIQCSELSIPDVVNRTTYQCLNSCSGTDCESIYLAVNGLAAEDGPFGSIYFTCEGDTLQDVDAYVNYVGGNNGTCAVSPSQTITRNIHIVRLGVSCPVGSSRDYVYDDTYFDCKSLGSFSLNTALDNDGENDIYTCGNGANCAGLECSVPFSDVYVNADVRLFFDRCVESTVPITPFPTAAPITSSFEFSAQFQASWGRLYDPTTSESACTDGNPGVIVSCGNGASISFVNSTDSSMNCTKVSEDELQCVGNGSNIDNIFTSVYYECVGPRLPSARVTYPGSTAFCDGNSVSTTVRHAVGLGIFCDRPSGQFYYHGDLFLECTDASDHFDVLYGEFGLDMFENYICSQSASFPAGSLATSTQVLSSTGITTEEFWLTDATEGCFTFTSVPRTPTTPSPPTPSPATNSPISSFPTASPIEVKLPTNAPFKEIGAPTSESTNIPISSPIVVPVVSRSAPPTTSEDSSSNAGAIAGGVIVGVAVLAIVAFLLLRKNGWSGDLQKPPVSGAVVPGSENTVFRENSHSTAHQSLGVSPHTDQTTGSSLTSDVTGPRIPVPVQTPSIPTSHSATPIPPGDSYDVRFKDQARSVIGPSQSAEPMVVSGVPMAEAIPIAVALDTSAASGASKNSLKSEPPGRRMEEP